MDRLAARADGCIQEVNTTRLYGRREISKTGGKQYGKSNHTGQL